MFDFDFVDGPMPDIMNRCLIVKTSTYNRDEVGKVVQIRAQVEGLKLGTGVQEKLAEEGERSSLRWNFCPHS